MLGKFPGQHAPLHGAKLCELFCGEKCAAGTHKLRPIPEGCAHSPGHGSGKRLSQTKNAASPLPRPPSAAVRVISATTVAIDRIQVPCCIAQGGGKLTWIVEGGFVQDAIVVSLAVRTDDNVAVDEGFVHPARPWAST